MSVSAYTITADTVTVVMDEVSCTVQKGAPNFFGLRDALLGERWEEAESYLTVARGIEHWAQGEFTVDGDSFYLRGEKLHCELNDRIVQMAANGEDPTRLMKFWERLQGNPSFRSVEQLYPFMQHEGIPIDDEGYILAYKAVDSSYRDFHTGTVDNSVGAENEMPRNKISDDPNQGCHDGFHVGALEYANRFGREDRRIVICRVDPADVVCIPYDSSFQKMRVCKYKVVGNFGTQLPSTTFKDEVPDGPDDDCESERLYSDFDDMDEGTLLLQSTEDLRGYAARDLKIVGASKIPGGKSALVARILQVRR
jgi:hypothetical protein